LNSYYTLMLISLSCLKMY